MFVTVLPLRAVLFQGVFLLIAIAIESFILHKQLGLSRRTSLEYAASLNLFSTVIGWLFFFLIQPNLPAELQRQLLQYIFFNRFAPGSNFPLLLLYTEAALIILLIFLSTLIAELAAVQILYTLLKQENHNSTEIDRFLAAEGSLKFNVLFTANIASYSFVLIIILLHFFF